MSRFFAVIMLLVLSSSFAYSEKLSGVVKAGGTSAVVLEPVAAKPSPAAIGSSRSSLRPPMPVPQR